MKKMRNVSQKGLETIDSFISSLGSRNLNPRTVQEYTADLKHFIGWHEYQGMDSCENVLVFSFGQISVKELETYLQAMKDVRLKTSTINRRLNTLKLFFEWAHENALSQQNPADCLRLVPIEKKPPRVIDSEEEKKLLDAVKQYGSLRDQAIIKLMIHTGLRVSETCDLKVEDLYLNNKSSYIQVGPAGNRRSIPLNSICKGILEKYLPSLKDDAIYLFSSEKTGYRLTERALRHLLKKYIDISGLEGVSAYSLRHNFGYRKAVKTPMHKLAHIMGHSNLNAAMNYKRTTKT